MRLNDADRMVNNVDLDQTAPSDLGLHCLLRPVSPKFRNITALMIRSFRTDRPGQTV